MRGPAAKCAALLWLVGSLGACAGNAGEPTPTPTPAACADIAAIDFAMPSEVAAGFDVAPKIISLVDALTTVLFSEDSTCPQVSGDELQNDSAGTATWTGGCTNQDGHSYEGSLTATWTRVSPEEFTAIFVGDELRFEAAPGGAIDGLERLQLDGQIDQNAAPGHDSFSLDGSALVTAQPTADNDNLSALSAYFPLGFAGAYSHSFEQLNDDLRDRNLQADLQAECRGDLSATWDLIYDGTVCELGEPSAGQATLSSGGLVADFNFDQDFLCDGCVWYDIDGVEQAEPLCFE